MLHNLRIHNQLPTYKSLYAIVKEQYRKSKVRLSLTSVSPDFKIGGGERDRTDDPLRARQVLSQLSYTPILMGTDECGGPRWTRTIDLTIISRVL